jgi:hypothetical protein
MMTGLKLLKTGHEYHAKLADKDSCTYSMMIGLRLPSISSYQGTTTSYISSNISTCNCDHQVKLGDIEPEISIRVAFQQS